MLIRILRKIRATIIVAMTDSPSTELLTFCNLYRAESPTSMGAGRLISLTVWCILSMNQLKIILLNVFPEMNANFLRS